jgi:hypothetical protein
VRHAANRDVVLRSTQAEPLGLVWFHDYEDQTITLVTYLRYQAPPRAARRRDTQTPPSTARTT